MIEYNDKSVHESHGNQGDAHPALPRIVNSRFRQWRERHENRGDHILCPGEISMGSET